MILRAVYFYQHKFIDLNYNISSDIIVI